MSLPHITYHPLNYSYLTPQSTLTQTTWHLTLICIPLPWLRLALLPLPILFTHLKAAHQPCTLLPKPLTQADRLTMPTANPQMRSAKPQRPSTALTTPGGPCHRGHVSLADSYLPRTLTEQDTWVPCDAPTLGRPWGRTPYPKHTPQVSKTLPRTVKYRTVIQNRLQRMSKGLGAWRNTWGNLQVRRELLRHTQQVWGHKRERSVPSVPED